MPSVLISGDIHVVFQPIVEVASGKTFAQEALLRSTSPNFMSPPALLAEAGRSGAIGAIGRIVRELATQGCPDLPLFLNVHPQEFDESWLVQPDDPIFTHAPGVYLEVTEAVPLSHFAQCQSVLKEIRSKGINLAIDDLGAGYSNLKYIADLKPEIVKLDRSLVADIHTDPRRQILVKHFSALCEDLGAQLVAEGIETQAEIDVIQEVGCHLAQGYFLARPSKDVVHPSWRPSRPPR